MRRVLTASLAAIAAMLLASGCAMNGRGPAGASAVPHAAAPYPAAVEAPPPHPLPARARSYSTPDSVATVKAWFAKHLKSAKKIGETAQGAAYLIGTEKTGSAIFVIAIDGKTWIVAGPASVLMPHF